MKPIPNFPNYFVDTSGNIYSMKPRSRYAPWPVFPRKRKLSIDSNGYQLVRLYKDGRGFTQKVARLVLETFVGLCPEGMEACHGSKGKLDDSLQNLCWGTHSKNQGEDRLRDGIDNRGEKNGHAKLTRKDVWEIRTLKGHKTNREVAKMFGIGRSNVSLIQLGKTWAWLDSASLNQEQ